MSLSFRKSTNIGPLRLTFSKSGIRTSLGVKGARISTGPGGTYVSLGANGICYRRKILTPPAPAPVHPYPEEANISTATHTITSGPMEQLSDTGSKDFIDELTRKAKRVSYAEWLSIYPMIAFLLALVIVYSKTVKVTYDKQYVIDIANTNKGAHVRSAPDKTSLSLALVSTGDRFNLLDSTQADWYQISYYGKTGFVSKQYANIHSFDINKRAYTRMETEPFGFFIWAILAIAGCSMLYYHLRKRDKKRMVTEIYYDMDERVSEVYNKFLESFNELSSSQQVWQFIHTQSVNGYKYHAGASNLINRIGVTSVHQDRKPVASLITNIKIPNINLRNTELYFFPERLILKRGKQFAGVFYKYLDIRCCTSRFIEEEAVPADSEIVGHTWKYLNKNGTPDRRFNGNRQLPICLYSEYHINSDSGVNEVITTSKVGAFDNFANFIRHIGELQKRMEAVVD